MAVSGGAELDLGPRWAGRATTAGELLGLAVGKEIERGDVWNSTSEREGRRFVLVLDWRRPATAKGDGEQVDRRQDVGPANLVRSDAGARRHAARVAEEAGVRHDAPQPPPARRCCSMTVCEREREARRIVRSKLRLG